MLQIDGLSGTGKSTLHAELVARGYFAVDADAELAYFGDPVTGEPTVLHTRENWIWDLRKISHIAATTQTVPVFVCGGALNQEQCADLFDRRFLLIIDDATMRQRLLSRTNNDYGKTDYELAEQLRLNRNGAAGERAGWILIDAMQPVTAVANDILQASDVGRVDPPNSNAAD